MQKSEVRRQALPTSRITNHKRGAAFFVACVLLTSVAYGQSDPMVAAPDPQSIVGAPENQPLEGDALDSRTKEVSSLLRCPVCQGLSVWDSPVDLAVNMRDQVRELLSQGYSEDQILEYFEASYGEFVRLAPATRGSNWLVWLLPGIVLIVGIGIVVRVMKGSSDEEAPAQRADDDSGSMRDALPDDPELAEWVLEVRKLAYGWKDGRSPRGEAE